MKNFSFKSFISGVLLSTVVLVPALSFGANSQTIDVIFGKIKLIVNGNNINENTLLYNGTTYLPIRAIANAIGADVSYDNKKYQATLTTTTQSDPQATYWANKVYILATSGDIDANKLIISNVTTSTFKESLLIVPFTVNII